MEHVLPRIAILFLVFLTSCRQDVRDLRLTEVDLANAAVIKQIGQELGPAEHAAFRTYLAVHGPSSPGTCGHKSSGHGEREPQTVGDAIALMQTGTAKPT